MILCIFLVSLAYTIACIRAGLLTRTPRPTLNRRGGRLARLLVANKQIT